MFDWLSDGALPFGFLMFFGMVYAFIKRRASHKLASRAFPNLAERLGLTYKPSPYRRGIGTLQGTLDGYRVFVDPDDQRKISLYFETGPAILLRNYAQNQRPPAELSRLYSGNKHFDAFFKTRYADEELSRRVREYRDWAPLIAQVQGEFRRELQQFNVSDTGISLVLNFGNPPHIPGGVVERLLKLLVRVASVIEPREQHLELRRASSKDEALR